MSGNDKLKILVLGTRGIPGIQGGVERHCEQLYPRIAARGHSVFLCTRTPYVKDKTPFYKGINLIHCYAPRNKSLEAITHTFIGLMRARLISPDVVHIHAIGPSLLTPVARLLGLRVVVTNHGPDYDRQKWGKGAKFILKLGEKLGGLYADEVIVISRVIQNIIRTRCHREAVIIPNGVEFPSQSSRTDFLAKCGLFPGNYILTVGRFVPEKGFHDLIDAFTGNFTDNFGNFGSDFKLVIAGDADHETPYSASLREKARQDKRIVLTGFITGEELNQIYHHARLFVLPSYHEGLPLALLEALSYGLSVLVSDIPAHREIGLSSRRYFHHGNISDLRAKIKLLLKEPLPEDEKQAMMRQIEKRYNWDRIADQTLDVYRRAINGGLVSKEIHPCSDKNTIRI